MRTVFFLARITVSGEELALVDLVDGTVVTFRNGEALAGHSWPADQLELAMQSFNGELHRLMKYVVEHPDRQHAGGDTPNPLLILPPPLYH